MSGNYPPGVSGFEPEIAGYPERELVAVERTCSLCEQTVITDVTVFEQGLGYAVEWWECPATIPAGWDDGGERICGYENETEVEYVDERDWDN